MEKGTSPRIFFFGNGPGTRAQHCEGTFNLGGGGRPKKKTGVVGVRRKEEGGERKGFLLSRRTEVCEPPLHKRKKKPTKKEVGRKTKTRPKESEKVNEAEGAFQKVLGDARLPAIKTESEGNHNAKKEKRGILAEIKELKCHQ